MGNARASVHDHQWRAVSNYLVIDEYAVCVNIAFLHLIDIGSCRRRRRSFIFLYLRKYCGRCNKKEHNYWLKSVLFHAGNYSCGVKQQKMIENIGKILVFVLLPKGLKYTYETAVFTRDTWNGCSSRAFLSCQCTNARRRWWWTYGWRRRISLLWLIRISLCRPVRLPLCSVWISLLRCGWIPCSQR